MEFDHELRLWLKSKKSRKTHLDTRVERRGSAERYRKIARGVDVIKGAHAGFPCPDRKSIMSSREPVDIVELG